MRINDLVAQQLGRSLSSLSARPAAASAGVAPVDSTGGSGADSSGQGSSSGQQDARPESSVVRVRSSLNLPGQRPVVRESSFSRGPDRAELSSRALATPRAASPAIASPGALNTSDQPTTEAPNTGADNTPWGWIEQFQRTRSAYAIQTPIRTAFGMGSLSFAVEVETAYRIIEPFRPGQVVDAQG